MPERPLTIAAYAATASLAAITLVYVFSPTYIWDDDGRSTRSSRKRGVVGLANPANDCFINSVLQTLAGIPELRLYLIREVHLRQIEADIYERVWEEEKRGQQTDEGEDPVAPFRDSNEGKGRMPEWKVLGLQKALVTRALKEMLDALNERPIYRKTLSAQGFVGALERAFRTRINRSQQDAQEFLQLITERMGEEYYAGRRARRAARRRTGQGDGQEMEKQEPVMEDEKAEKKEEEQDTTFPFEGKIESQIECTHCRFKPKPSASSFVTLTLHVPQGGNSTSLSTCFDSMLKVEHIDDFICARCRINHALETSRTQLASLSARNLSSPDLPGLRSNISALEECLVHDPEEPPKDLTLPPMASVPRRRIARHSRIAVFPRVLAIHLSRSMWSDTTSSAKNLAKVSFPEFLPLGGILDQVRYRLLGVVTHKGGHNSGHYESFRRQISRDLVLSKVDWGPDAKGRPNTLTEVGEEGAHDVEAETTNGKETSTEAMTPSLPTESDPTSSVTSLGRTSSQSRAGTEETGISTPTTVTEGVSSSSGGSKEEKRPGELARKSSLSKMKERFQGGQGRQGKSKTSNRWWRISDDKIKECTTKDVLKQEREVYLLFYEMVPKEES